MDIKIPNSKEFFSMLKDKDYISLCVVLSSIAMFCLSILMVVFDFNIHIWKARVPLGISIVLGVISIPVRGFRMYGKLISIKNMIIKWMYERREVYKDKSNQALALRENELSIIFKVDSSIIKEALEELFKDGTKGVFRDDRSNEYYYWSKTN